MKTAASDRIAEPHHSSVKISEHGKQKLHKLLMQDKSPKPKILKACQSWQFKQFNTVHCTASTDRRCKFLNSCVTVQK